MTKEQKKTSLELLREPFEEKHIGKLPKPTKTQTKIVKDDFKKGIRCQLCGAWHHPDVVHLDYVGHAALTDRLLDADPYWYWEPISFIDSGLPAFDTSGGLWIRLYIHDGDKIVNRLGYGHAAESNFKEIGSREKEVIGDALRNAAMRFGAALDLWHKGDLHPDKDDDETKDEPPKNQWSGPLNKTALKEQIHAICNQLNEMGPKDSEGHIQGIWSDEIQTIDQARKDSPELYNSVVDAGKRAKERVNAFPGDLPNDDPFSSPAGGVT